MREVVLDTETTGLRSAEGDRLVEIGCIELENHIPTGVTHHAYVNPERDMPDAAFQIHGLSEEFLMDKPVFKDVADAFLEFLGDAQLVIHNAEFDIGFLNAELQLLERKPIPLARAVDTLSMARRKFPGALVNLDALCRRFGIDNSERTKHGALLDAELLADVYLELIGGRQIGLTLSVATKTEKTDASRVRRSAREFPVDPEEARAHEAFIAGMDDPIWKKA